MDEVPLERRLTQAEYDMYMELLSDIPPPIGSLWSPSPPPLSPAPEEGRADASVSPASSQKRKYDEYSAGEDSQSSTSSSKRAKRSPDTLTKAATLSQHLHTVPLRVRLNKSQTQSMTTPAKKAAEWALSHKREGDKGYPSFEWRNPQHQKVANGLVQMHHHTLSVIWFAYQFRRDRNIIHNATSSMHAWKSLHGLLDQTKARFESYKSLFPKDKALAWLGFLQLFANMVTLAVEREQLRILRQQFVNAINTSSQDEHAAHGPSPISSGESPAPIPASGSTPTPSHPHPHSTPTLAHTTPSGPRKILIELDESDVRNYQRILGKYRNGPIMGDEHEKRLHKLNDKATLKSFFPRTFARAFGPDGVGHGDGEGADGLGPLLRWEEYEIADLDLEETEGRDFCFPAQAEDVMWILLLGRGMLSEMEFLKMAEMEKKKDAKGPIVKREPSHTPTSRPIPPKMKQERESSFTSSLSSAGASQGSSSSQLAVPVTHLSPPLDRKPSIPQAESVPFNPPQPTTAPPPLPTPGLPTGIHSLPPKPMSALPPPPLPPAPIPHAYHFGQHPGHTPSFYPQFQMRNVPGAPIPTTTGGSTIGSPRKMG